MKQKVYVLFIMVGLLIFASSAAFAMGRMSPGGCSGMDRMKMCCSMDGMGGMDMSSCDSTACTCNHMESMECQPGCACCAMCAEDGCQMGAEGCCNMNMTSATLDFYPGTMDIKSKGRYITAYIEIEENDNQNTIDQIDKMSICLKKANETMIMINGKMLYTIGPVEIGDYDEDGTPDLMVKFDRQALSRFLLANGFKSGEVMLTVCGKFYDGTKFMGMKDITIQIKKSTK